MTIDPKEMPLLMHLRELRERLIKIFVAVGVASVAFFTQADNVFSVITAPLLASQHGGHLIGTGPIDAFMVKIHLAILSGFIVSLPITFYQLWSFIAPGLNDKERRFAIPFVICTTLSFLLGAAFCYYAVLPAAFDFFLAEYVSIGVTPAIRIDEYISLLVRLILVFGLVFEMPMLSYLLSKMHLITSQWLIRQFRIAIVLIFLVAGIITPGPDVASQLLLAGPMLVLYGICIAVARVGERAAK
jgi:sec-independent protein translocase protein TatC